ncbi:hypothetical protein HMF8227_01096 [Saliniradius amylolyticus]|uniref:Uncharacterized protein n=1 Tax=Saliniradius amylolyticus TaxID=2183582 RepID=A0A2S2E234_9ALTE|nr:hypothetical protein [Saliniradius amylolyticus]AWL11582.1 hypothetical protein HMF8227_01096 [Saliniradius amylolyticus]
MPLYHQPDHRRRRRQYEPRRRSIKDENIDRQILVLHQAMLDKLQRHPELLPAIFEVLEQRREMGKLRHGAYLTWYCALEQLTRNPKRCFEALLDDTPRMRKLRRKTPLVGILTEEERQQALTSNACGEGSVGPLIGH